MNENNNKNEKKRYGLASAVSRTFTRFFDLLLILLVLIVCFFAVFSNLINKHIDFSNLESWENEIESWRIFFFTFLIFIFFWIYFIFVPFITKGYTLFSKIFKIRIYSTSLQIINEKRKIFKNWHFLFLLQLIIRESLTIILLIVITLILGIVSLFDKKDVVDFLATLIISSSDSSDSNIVAIAFESLYSIVALVEIVLIINVAFTSRRRSFTDAISNTVVVKMIETFTDDKKGLLNVKEKKKTSIKYNLPGEINPNEIFDKEEKR